MQAADVRRLEFRVIGLSRHLAMLWALYGSAHPKVEDALKSLSEAVDQLDRSRVQLRDISQARAELSANR